jgi:TonB family protein
MSDRNKNIKSNLSEFLRYKKNEMSGKERNSFERELQKDPFAEEAFKGFASITPEEASKDILQLQKQIRSKTVSHNRSIIYRIAASIAVLLVISSIFLMVERNKTVSQLSVADTNKAKLEIAENFPIKAPVSKDDAQLSQVEDKHQKINISPDRKKASENAKGAGQVAELKSETLSVTDQVPLNKINASEENITEKQAASPMKAMPNERAIALAALKEQEVKSDANEFISQDTTGSELDEVIVTGYGRAQSIAKKDYGPGGYVAPVPVIGKEAFDKYLQENQHRIDSTGQRAVVVVSFIVRSDGKLDSISIVRSADKLFSDEAIRLIKTGPSWKPAQVDGKFIDDEVRVKVVFK